MCPKKKHKLSKEEKLKHLLFIIFLSKILEIKSCFKPKVLQSAMKDIYFKEYTTFFFFFKYVLHFIKIAAKKVHQFLKCLKQFTLGGMKS